MQGIDNRENDLGENNQMPDFHTYQADQEVPELVQLIDEPEQCKEHEEVYQVPQVLRVPSGGKGVMFVRSKKDKKPSVSTAALRRLARKAGVRSMSKSVNDIAIDALRQFLSKIVGSAIVYTEYGRRSTVQTGDVIHALKFHGHTLYGFAQNEKKP